MSESVIAVFGSSSPQPDSTPYAEARRVGRLLAETGFVVATGGYGGTMAAVSQGASEAGGKVIGVTCRQIERWRPIPANEWVAEEIKYDTLTERLLHLVKRYQGMIALPGGIGTLSEVALAWSLMQTDEAPQRPLVLLGPLWRETIRTYAQDEYIRPRDMDLIYMANSAETAVGYIRQRLLAK